jgi:hypothetical protein
MEYAWANNDMYLYDLIEIMENYQNNNDSKIQG